MNEGKYARDEREDMRRLSVSQQREEGESLKVFALPRQRSDSLLHLHPVSFAPSAAANVKDVLKVDRSAALVEASGNARSCW